MILIEIAIEDGSLTLLFGPYAGKEGAQRALKRQGFEGTKDGDGLIYTNKRQWKTRHPDNKEDEIMAKAGQAVAVIKRAFSF